MIVDQMKLSAVQQHQSDNTFAGVQLFNNRAFGAIANDNNVIDGFQGFLAMPSYPLDAAIQLSVVSGSIRVRAFHSLDGVNPDSAPYFSTDYVTGQSTLDFIPLASDKIMINATPGLGAAEASAILQFLPHTNITVNATVSALSVPDGADVNAGAKADAAIITDVAGTLSGKLRGVIRLIGRILGLYGGTVISDIIAHNGLNCGKITAVTAVVISAITLGTGWTGTLAGITMAAGTSLEIPFTSITLTSGTAALYNC